MTRAEYAKKINWNGKVVREISFNEPMTEDRIGTVTNFGLSWTSEEDPGDYVQEFEKEYAKNPDSKRTEIAFNKKMYAKPNTDDLLILVKKYKDEIGDLKEELAEHKTAQDNNKSVKEDFDELFHCGLWPFSSFLRLPSDEPPQNCKCPITG